MWRLIWGRRWGCIDARLHCIDGAVNASIFGHHIQQRFYCCSRPPFFWDWSQICCTDNGNHNKGKACQANKNHSVNLCLHFKEIYFCQSKPKALIKCLCWIGWIEFLMLYDLWIHFLIFKTRKFRAFTGWKFWLLTGHLLSSTDFVYVLLISECNLLSLCVKFGFSEKATKFEKSLHRTFDKSVVFCSRNSVLFNKSGVNKCPYCLQYWREECWIFHQSREDFLEVVLWDF